MKIFTSGSFLDSEEEVSPDLREWILDTLASKIPSLKIIQMETRPEFVTDEVADRLSEWSKARGIKVCLNIGLESASDEVLQLINKGFTYADYASAVRRAKSRGLLVKTYLLLKPPFMTEREAVEDAVRSAERAFQEGTDVVSLNPLVVFSHTLVEWLWRRCFYRPPLMESVCDAVRRILSLPIARERIVMCSPVAPGTPRGPHSPVREHNRILLRLLQDMIRSQQPLDLPPACAELLERFSAREDAERDLGMSLLRLE